MSKPPLARYRTTNWPSYNDSLKHCGSLMVWPDPELQWQAVPSGRTGRPAVLSDAAIQFCVTLKCMFGLGLRQATGLAESLLKLAQLDWNVPDYSTLSRTQKLFAQIPQDELLHSVRVDGAYDTKACHEAIAHRHATAIIPTHKNAKLWAESRAGTRVRNEFLRATRELGRSIWKKWSGYHRRSLVEVKMGCFKRPGKQVMARDFERQVTKLQVRVSILNRFTQLGTPETVRVA
ncbi:MAG: hypothetical protein EOP04_05260 [Proteobacteria bacterium]|nr:MAG: hypothetical protein EOP04_05260 [Pseudomonadota bacterium]